MFKCDLTKSFKTYKIREKFWAIKELIEISYKPHLISRPVSENKSPAPNAIFFFEEITPTPL